MIMFGNTKQDSIIRKLSPNNYFTPFAPKHSKKHIEDALPRKKFIRLTEQSPLQSGKLQSVKGSKSFPKLPTLKPSNTTLSKKEILSIIDLSAYTSRFNLEGPRHLQDINQKIKRIAHHISKLTFKTPPRNLSIKDRLYQRKLKIQNSPNTHSSKKSSEFPLIRQFPIKEPPIYLSPTSFPEKLTVPARPKPISHEDHSHKVTLIDISKKSSLKSLCFPKFGKTPISLTVKQRGKLRSASAKHFLSLNDSILDKIELSGW